MTKDRGERGRAPKDLYKRAYDMNHSPFVFDIDAQTGEIVIDLDKKS